MRPFVRTLAAVLAASAILSCLVVPVLGKEFLQARLDAPIALGTPPGTEILVGVTVTAPAEDGTIVGVEGSPIQLIVTGRYGTTTRAAGAADGEPGHYTMRITIPDGGAREVEVVMHGTSDLPITLTADPFTFGGVTARTAQVAPPLAPPMTPFPRVSAAAGAAVASVPAPAPWGIPAVAAAGLIGLAAVLVVGVLGRARRSRAARLVAGAPRVPGA